MVGIVFDKNAEEAEIIDLQRQLDDARAAINDETKRADDQYEVACKWKGLADEREKMLADRSEKIADLKERLANAETANQFMRGYLARVQEDDRVREELIKTGEPGIEERLVPKRKSTTFDRPTDYRERQRDSGIMGSEFYIDHSRDKPRAKHWITY